MQFDKQVVFGGVCISYDTFLNVVDINAEKSKLAAIKDLKSQGNKKFYQSLLRICSQLSQFFPDIMKKVKKHEAMACRENTWKAAEDLKTELEELKTYLNKKLNFHPLSLVY